MTNSLPLLIEELLASSCQSLPAFASELSPPWGGLGLVNPRNLVYLRNLIYARLGLQFDHELPLLSRAPRNLAVIAAEIIGQLSAAQQASLGPTRECQETSLLNLLLPLPDQMEAIFTGILQEHGCQAALDWFHQANCAYDYIKVAALARNVSWQQQSDYGQLLITINLSKPEKDPREIAAAKLAEQQTSNYPQCLLCAENEGYLGRHNHPARAIHRLLTLDLASGPWFFQFSPYAYYPQHAIILNPEHRDMRIDSATFANFFAFVDWAPHYMIGSNSDIPIVGGSILTHDHYQAGLMRFPLEDAAVHFSRTSQRYPAVTINYLNWPLSTIQLQGPRAQLEPLIEEVCQAWYAYANPELAIVPLAASGERHNAITPIMRKLADDYYCVYLILRNNRCSEEHPLGIFHPHHEHHHIKKENIGLIEAMGLAILPGRLKTELASLAEYLPLANGSELVANQPKLAHHLAWFKQLQPLYQAANQPEAAQFLAQAVGDKFALLLSDCGVFKADQQGQEAAYQFCAQF